MGCRMTNLGRSFAVAFINNVVENSTYQLEIYPTSFARQPLVDVRVRLTDGGWDESVRLASGRSVMVDVPTGVELTGTGMSRKAVLVTTGDDEEVETASQSTSSPFYHRYHQKSK